MPTAQVKEIYTDGACSGNPGPGGWGTRIEFADGQVHELGGRDTATTNNRMEMQAAIAALEFLKDRLDDADIAQSNGVPVILHTDSEYLKNGITKWIKGWKRKGWKTSAGKPVLNKDLWQQLDRISQSLTSDELTVDWRYVRGHTGNLGNERCDEIARAYSHAQPISLSQFSQRQSIAEKERKPSGKVKTAQAEPENAEKNEAQSTQSPKKNLIATPENLGTTKESSEAAALRFYETSSSVEQATENVMAASSSSKSHNEPKIIPESARIERLKNTLETLQITDELAKQGYLITSAELADLMDVNASAVTSRGDYWAWRNWSVSRIRREGNQILWQLERIDE